MHAKNACLKIILQQISAPVYARLGKCNNSKAFLDINVLFIYLFKIYHHVIYTLYFLNYYEEH